MPRRSILSTIEIDNLLAPPSDEGELIRHYTFSEADLSIIRQHRGASNRLGFAIQLGGRVALERKSMLGDSRIARNLLLERVTRI
jgi:hypothetical protein